MFQLSRFFMLLLLMFSGLAGCVRTDPPLFEETIEGRTFAVTYGSETRGQRVQKLLYASIHKKGDLIGRCRPFSLADETAAVSLERAENIDFLCLFDIQELGFITILNKENGEFFVSSSNGPRGGLSEQDFQQWQQAYRLLKNDFSSLPYEEYFGN